MNKNRIKSIAAVLLAFGLTLGLAGCGGKIPKINEVETATLYLTDEGTVTAFLVEEFDKDYYDESELEQMILEEIEDYCAQASAGDDQTVPVRLVDICSPQEKNAAEGTAGSATTVTVQMEYASVEDYTTFNGKTLYLGTVREAKTFGYPVRADLTAVKDGSLLSKEQAQGMDDSHILILQENMTVQVPWKVLYVSPGVTADGNMVTYEGADGGYAYVLMK